MIPDATRFLVNTSSMDEQSVALTETEMLKTGLQFKDNEIFALRAELERRDHMHHDLLMAIERLEKTVAANLDRILRRVDRLAYSADSESRKRRRR